jgi:hypothetical protein
MTEEQYLEKAAKQNQRVALQATHYDYISSKLSMHYAAYRKRIPMASVEKPFEIKNRINYSEKG